MRVRLNRCHQMGTSNRMETSEQSFPGFNRAASLAESAHGKLAATSNSLSKTAAATAAFKSTVESINNRKHAQSRSLYEQQPMRTTFTFQQRNHESVHTGDDMQLHSNRFNADSFRANEYAMTYERRVPIQGVVEPLGQTLNKEVKQIKEHFETRDINMHKLKEIKRAFLKNFADKHRVKQVYEQYANSDGKIGNNGVKKLVREFGFDVNDDEIKLMLSLTNNKVHDSVALGIEEFISLTSKPNIFFETLKLKDHKELKDKPRTFSKKVHLILRNSFLRLKEAMRIYDQQGIPLNEDEFRKVFKKLDLTDLVISDAEIKNVYEQFKHPNGIVNQEKLLCAVAEQQNLNILMKKRPVDVEFEDHVGRHKQLKDQYERNYLKHVDDLRKLSNNDYEKELKRIRLLSNDIKKVFPDRKDFDRKLKGALGDNISTVSREHLSGAVEKVLQQAGLNYHKNDYEALMATLRYNTSGQAKLQDIGQALYHQSPEDLDDRMDRRCRDAPPNLVVRPNEVANNEVDLNSPLKEGLRKIDDAFLHDELAKTFKQFDSDRDGYVSIGDFQSALQKKSLLSKQQLENVTDYLDREKKGYLTFQQLHERLHSNIVNHLNKTNLPTLLPKTATTKGGWISSKRNFIQTANQYDNNIPSKYSAWPTHITTPDLSLIQPHGKSGMFSTEKERFNVSQKDSFGQECKQRTLSIQQAKVNRRMAWEQTLQQRIDQSRESQVRHDQQTNQLKRLAQEIYQRNCHKQY